jgi:hypothetical protein
LVILNKIKSADSLGPLVRSTRVGLTVPARPSRLPPLSHSATRANPNPLSSVAILNRRRPRRSIPASSGGFCHRRAGHLLRLLPLSLLTVEIWRSHLCSSTSPPFVAPDEFALELLDPFQLGFARAPALLLGICCWSPSSSSVGRHACNPGAPLVWCCGGYLAMGRVLPLAVIATGRWCYAATTVDTPSVSLIRPKRIYFPEHFCYCFSSNLCALNTTNTESRCFQQNCSGVSFLCRNPTFGKNSGKIGKNPISQKTHGARRRDGGEARGLHTHRGRGPALTAPTWCESGSAVSSTSPSAYIYPLT